MKKEGLDKNEIVTVAAATALFLLLRRKKQLDKMRRTKFVPPVSRAGEKYDYRHSMELAARYSR